MPMKPELLAEFRLAAANSTGSIASEEIRIPIEPEPGAPRKPIVVVPEPAEWIAPVTRLAPAILEADDDKMRDVTSNAIAVRLLRCLDARFVGAVLAANKRVWAYVDGIFEPLPECWLDKAIQNYHGAMSEQQKQDEPGAGSPWFFSPSTLACVRKSLFTELDARQLQMGEDDPLASSPALAVFGQHTLLFDPKTRQARIEPNSREWRATFAYPFEWTPEPCEPPWLMRVMREDMFRDVEEKERELRIERIRQQLGLAMLGAGGITRIHSVLVMKGKGRDGKSLILELLQLCSPPNACLSLSPQDLSTGTGEGAEGRADLHARFSVICDDVSTKAMRDSSHYKTATAYGTLRGRKFGGGVHSFQFRPKAVWLMACQELWETADKTHGFQERHALIDMPNSIDKQFADRGLAARLFSLEWREIVLWACQAAIPLMAGGQLAVPECSARLMREWMLGGDDICSFLEANTVDISSKPKAEWPPTDEMWSHYVEWCARVHAAGGKHKALTWFAQVARKVPGVTVGLHPTTRRSIISRVLKV